MRNTKKSKNYAIPKENTSIELDTVPAQVALFNRVGGCSSIFFLGFVLFVRRYQCLYPPSHLLIRLNATADDIGRAG